MPDSPITLEPGRLALRKPELGGFMMVEVKNVGALNKWGHTFRADTPPLMNPKLRVSDFLPVLKPGDVVLAGSLVLRIPSNQEIPWVGAFWPVKESEAATYALLRWGPEEDDAN